MNYGRATSWASSIALIISANSVAYAQPVDTTATTFESRLKTENDLGDLLGLADPLIKDKAQEGLAATSIAQASGIIAKELLWSGDKGYLVKVNVETETNTDISRLLGAPELIGGGSDEADVLERYFSSDRLRASPSSGFHYDSDRSFYIWITPVSLIGAHPTFSYAFTPPDLSGKVQDSARARLAEADIAKQKSDQDRNAVMLAVIKQLQTQTADQDERNRLKQIENNITEAQTHLAGIEQQLASALAAEQAGDRLITMLSVIKTVLSIVVLTGEIQATINVPAEQASLPTIDLSGTPDQQMLEQRVTTWRKNIGGVTQTYQGVLSTWGPKLQQAQSDALKSVPDNTVPGEVLQRMR